MPRDFPELTSFGTLLKFAIALEDTVAKRAHLSADNEECAERQNTLVNCADRHERRSAQLERMRRERLNEVVLQPIYGLDRSKYIPAAGVSDDANVVQMIAAVVDAEETTARFYRKTAETAANVLTGVERTFKRLATESQSLAAQLAAWKTEPDGE